MCVAETELTQDGELESLMPITEAKLGTAGWGRNEGQTTVVLRTSERAWG